MFLFSMIFSFFYYIPRPYSGHFKFSTFFSFPRLYHVLSVCIYFSVIFSFLLYSRSFSVHLYFSSLLVISLFFVAGGCFFIFHDFQFFLLYSTSLQWDIFKFFHLFSVSSLYISRPKVCILFSVIFSFFAYIPGPSVYFHFSRFFSDFIIFRRWRMFYFP